MGGDGDERQVAEEKERRKLERELKKKQRVEEQKRKAEEKALKAVEKARIAAEKEAAETKKAEEKQRKAEEKQSKAQERAALKRKLTSSTEFRPKQKKARGDMNESINTDLCCVCFGSYNEDIDSGWSVVEDGSMRSA